MYYYSYFHQGALIPKALSHKRLRKIAIEVHRQTNNVNSTGSAAGSYEECIVRFLQPASKQVQKAARAAHKKEHKHKAGEASSLMSGAMNSSSVVTGADHADDTSVAGVPKEYRIDQAVNEEGWEAKYRYPIHCMSIKGTVTHKAGVFIRVELGPTSKHTRELIFDSTAEAEEFVKVVNQELNLEKERAEAKLRLAFSGKKNMSSLLDIEAETKQEITFLFEVVSGWDLPAGDLFTSDPYVLVHHGKKDIHKTKYLSRTYVNAFVIGGD